MEVCGVQVEVGAVLLDLVQAKLCLDVGVVQAHHQSVQLGRLVPGVRRGEGKGKGGERGKGKGKGKGKGEDRGGGGRGQARACSPGQQKGYQV